jgi:hypothetical protein
MKKKYTVIIGLTVDESKNIFSNLSKKITENQELIVFNYNPHSPKDLIFNLNIMRTDLSPKGCSMEKNFFDLCLEHKSKILNLFGRQMIQDNELSYAEVEYLYFSTILNCINWFKYNDIELVYARSYPQFAFDYLFFLYCSMKKIPYIFEYQSPYLSVANFYEAKIKNQDFIISRLNKKSIKNNGVPDTHNFKSIASQILSSIEKTDDAQRVSYYDVQGLFERKKNYKLSQLLWNTLKVGIPEIAREFLYKDSVHFSRFNLKSSFGKKIPERAGALSIMKKSILSFYSARNALKKYQKMSEKCDLNFPAKTKVLYVAHQEPEATILVEGGRITSNYEAIKYAQSIMPNDTIIYYKEHEANFCFYDLIEQGNAPENRPSNMYDLLSIEENIHCIPIEETNKKKILDKIDVVVTVCGTFAIEASMYGIPVIVLADPWYMESGVENLIKPEVFSSELIDKTRYDKEKIFEQWESFLTSTLQSGFFCPAYHNSYDCTTSSPDRISPEYLKALSETISSIHMREL